MIVDLGYRTVIDLLPFYLTIQDRSLHVMFANQNFRNDFGEAVGRLCHEIYKGKPERCEYCPVQRSFDDQKVHLSEETVRLPNDEMARMIVYSVPILDISGRVKAVMELSANISKIKEMRRELEFIGQSIAMLSHDIKNILEGLQGGAYVVDEGVKDGDMELAGKGWSIVKKNISELTDFTQNILYASKKRVPKVQKVAPDQVVRDVVSLFQEEAKAAGIELNSRTNAALPAVGLDPSIRRLLGNLIQNALEACRNDKDRDVHHVLVRADFCDRGHFMFEVEDDGVGMDEDTVNHIFGDFFSTKGSSGTGLGLMVVDKIAKEHGGRIELLTAPGKGTTFRAIFEIK